MTQCKIPITLSESEYETVKKSYSEALASGGDETTINRFLKRIIINYLEAQNGKN